MNERLKSLERSLGEWAGDAEILRTAAPSPSAPPTPYAQVRQAATEPSERRQLSDLSDRLEKLASKLVAAEKEKALLSKQLVAARDEKDRGLGSVIDDLQAELESGRKAAERSRLELEGARASLLSATAKGITEASALQAELDKERKHSLDLFHQLEISSEERAKLAQQVRELRFQGLDVSVERERELASQLAALQLLHGNEAARLREMQGEAARLHAAEEAAQQRGEALERALAEARIALQGRDEEAAVASAEQLRQQQQISALERSLTALQRARGAAPSIADQRQDFVATANSESASAALEQSSTTLVVLEQECASLRQEQAERARAIDAAEKQHVQLELQLRLLRSKAEEYESRASGAAAARDEAVRLERDAASARLQLDSARDELRETTAQAEAERSSAHSSRERGEQLRKEAAALEEQLLRAREALLLEEARLRQTRATAADQLRLIQSDVTKVQGEFRARQRAIDEQVSFIFRPLTHPRLSPGRLAGEASPLPRGGAGGSAQRRGAGAGGVASGRGGGGQAAAAAEDRAARVAPRGGAAGGQAAHG